jgi:hypothetical protein
MLSVLMRVARVSLINNANIRIQNVSERLKDSLSGKGIDLVLDGSGFPAIEFPEKEGDLLRNEEFITLVKVLVSEGVAFCRDYKQMFPPSYVVEELKSRGVINQEIVTCGFNGTDWVYEAS